LADGKAQERVRRMQRMEQDPDELATGAAPRQSESDRPPVGEPLVVSRRNPAARPAAPDRARGGAARRTMGGVAAAPDGAPDRAAPLDGRVALVTSAASELGAAMAAALVDRGARVLLVDRDLGALVDAVDDLAWGRAVPVWCDLGSPAAVASACEFVTRAATVDVVVHVGDDPVSSDGERPGLDDRFGTTVRGPLSLVDGLGPALAPAARVLLVDRPVPPDADALDRVAPELVREHLPVAEDVFVARAACAPALSPERFADAVLDLLARDDVVLQDVSFDAVADPRAVTAPADPEGLDGIGDPLR
jgi:hypothetical protein